jgi:hypothetical protein
MNELLIVVVSFAIFLFSIGTLIHRGISADVEKIGVTLEDSTNAIKVQAPQPLPECTCNPPQGASGWRCGMSPCGVTERLVTTTCIPTGCGQTHGIKEQECIEDSECCDEFRDTNYCGTGGPTPDCPIGSRIIQKVCGHEKSVYDCRYDFEDSEVDKSPTCKPKCLGNFSTNEAAAIVNPKLPIICPGDDTDLENSNGPWSRDKGGLGIPSKLLGSGVTVCNHPSDTAKDQKCELYCLNGYIANPKTMSCDPISCQKDPVSLNAIISNEELSEGTSQSYEYTIPESCPFVDANSYITFDITLGEATVDLWNNTTSSWDTLSTSGDNNNFFESLKLYPLSSDSKYIANKQIKWRISQAAGDKDSFFSTIKARECDHPSLPLHVSIQSTNESLSNDSVILRSYTIPKECNPINESSQFSADIQLINATLQVYDVNADTWSEIATSGRNNQQFLSLKYHPLGLENRYFKEDQITWRISKAKNYEGNFQAGISIAECYVSMCSGAPKDGWVTAMGQTTSCAPVCASAGLNPGISPEGMSCASGENRPMSGTGTISYIHDCSSGMGCNGNMPGPTQTHYADINCYRNGQTEDSQLTDITVACYCQL